LTALSIHSLLAGLALGAQPDLAGALVIFGAVVAHKSIAGFALGVSLARSAMPSARAWGLLWLFSAATPLGILIGAGFEAALSGPAQRMFEATFLALTAGTFGYVATVDILRDEFHESHGHLREWVYVAAGTGLMAVLARWV
jgi:zinc transporter 1/2/3